MAPADPDDEEQARLWQNFADPFLTADELLERLDGVEDLAKVEQFRGAHEVLGCPTIAGRWVYPAWQLEGGAPLRGLADRRRAPRRRRRPVDRRALAAHAQRALQGTAASHVAARRWRPAAALTVVRAQASEWRGERDRTMWPRLPDRAHRFMTGEPT